MKIERYVEIEFDLGDILDELYRNSSIEELFNEWPSESEKADLIEIIKNEYADD